MTEQEQKLKSLIEDANSVLITSHISPDPDAVTSSLLLSKTLQTNFPDKKVTLVLEEKPEPELSFLKGYESISYMPLADAVNEIKPSLFIIVDANQYKRVSRDPSSLIRTISSMSLRCVAIDHHESTGMDEFDAYINNGYPASVEEVYHLIFDKWQLNKPEDFENITMVGLLSDTLRFKYKNAKYKQTFALASTLVEAGADIEKLENRLEHYSMDEIKVIGQLASNITSTSNFSYSHVSDEFTSEWLNLNKNISDFRGGTDAFVNRYIRNIGENKWGFIVYKDLATNENIYSVSLRSEGAAMDVSKIATALGGGGHKPAAGAKLEAASVSDALNKVLEAIENTVSS